MFKKLLSAKYFSSDLNLNTLIYTEKNGSICYLNSQNDIDFIESDFFKKYIKFYPPDNCVFTTTDSSGLTVYDFYKNTPIFKYKNETLNNHAYSKNCIIATSDNYNIKFYDLKCRYLINSFLNSGNFNSKNLIDWIDNKIYLYDGNDLKIYDYRNMNLINTIDQVENVAILENESYFIKKNKERENYLYRLNNDGSFVHKKILFDKIISLKNQNSIVQIKDDKIKIENNNFIKEITLGINNIENIHFDNNKGYLFANDEIYLIECDYNRFLNIN